MNNKIKLSKMKKLNQLLFAVIILFTACKPKELIIKTKGKPNEIISTPELKAFLKENPNPSVVLRVPFSTSAVSESEQKVLSNNQNLYGQIEKNLLKSGYTVRDRGLLNNLLASSQADYAEIGKKIKTDLIIEILSTDFAQENLYNRTRSDMEVIQKKKSKPMIIDDNSVDPQIAKLECKIIIVNSGQTGAISTLYFTNCMDGCDFYRYRSGSVAHIKGRAYAKIIFEHDSNQKQLDRAIKYFSENIVNILRGGI